MNNPVLSREFRLLIRNEVLIKRVFYAWLFLAFVIYSVWPQGGMLSTDAQASRIVFKLFAFGQLTLCLLMAPAITAPLITDEKEHDRFAMLFASLLTPFDVLLGKWLSSFVFQLIAILSGLPLLMLTLMLGGVSWQDILQVYMVCIVTLLQFGMLGIYLSSIKSKTYDALLQSYGWMLVWTVVTWLPSYLLGNFEFLAVPFALLRSMSPFSALFDVVSPEVLIYLGRLPAEWSFLELWSADFLVYIVSGILLSCLLFFMSLKKVFLLPLGKDVRSQVKESDAKKKKFPYTLINTDKRRKPFGVSNLMFVKELRVKMFGHIGNLIRGVYAGIGISMGLVILVTLNVATLSLEAVRVVSVLFQLLIILLLSPALTASAVSDEYNSGTMEMLRMTPVSAWKFWYGKMKAAVFYMVILLLSSLPIYGMFVVFEIVMKGNPLIVIDILLTQFLLLLLCITCGIWSSAVLKNTQKAVGLAYFILSLIMVTPFSAEYFFTEGIVLEWMSSFSSFLMCIQIASIDLYKEMDLFSKHLIVIGVLISLMLGHSLLITSKLMRQAR